MIEIVRAKAPRAKQPWHVRLRSGGNTKKLLTGEQLTDPDAVATELEAVGREFSPVGRASYTGNETGGVLTVFLEEDDDPDDQRGEHLHLPVEVVDERETAEGDPPEKPDKGAKAKKTAAADS